VFLKNQPVLQGKMPYMEHLGYVYVSDFCLILKRKPSHHPNSQIDLLGAGPISWEKSAKAELAKSGT
jgi:hypothetical protein